MTQNSALIIVDLVSYLRRISTGVANMGKWIVAVCMAGLLAGCSTEPPQANSVRPGKVLPSVWSEPSPGNGVLVITRDAGLADSICTMRAYLDGVAIGDLRMSQRITIYPNSGEHIAGVKGCTVDDENSLTIANGETKRLRISVGPSGAVKIAPTAF
jgi:hypothetical protein